MVSPVDFGLLVFVGHFSKFGRHASVNVAVRILFQQKDMCCSCNLRYLSVQAKISEEKNVSSSRELAFMETILHRPKSKMRAVL